MSNRQQIEAEILKLPSEEFQRLRQWFFDLDYQRWDEQLEKDVADGKLEDLAEEAIADCDQNQLLKLSTTCSKSRANIC